MALLDLDNDGYEYEYDAALSQQVSNNAGEVSVAESETIDSILEQESSGALLDAQGASASQPTENNESEDDVMLLQDTQDRSLVADLHSHLSHVTLVEADGLEVMAARSALAVRSSFFRKLFFGNFSESSSPHATLGRSSKVIKAVVERRCADEAQAAFPASQQRRRRAFESRGGE